MSKPRSKQRYSHVKSVTAALDPLSQATPASDWLGELRRRALSKDPGWKAAADAYVQGLAAAGAMTPEAAAACRGNLVRCVDSDPGWREFLLPMAWISLVAAVSVTCRTLARDTTLLALLAVSAAIAGGLWAGTRPWLEGRNDPRLRRWDRPVVIGACVLMVPMLTYLIALTVGYVIQRVSVEQFNADRAAFVADPQGFPLLRQLAREQYGVEVVLGDAHQDWVPTAVNLPNALIATMAPRSGYCFLSMHRANVLRDFDPVAHVDTNLWVQGVMMHELAHCLDGSRDMPAFGQKFIGTHSLAPVDAKDVTDIHGFLEAEKKSEATRLWREAVADTFVVGYWKLTAPGSASNLVARLRDKRANAELDTTHATMCWIAHADRAALPASTADLFTWADRLRASAACELPKPKKLTRLQQWVRDGL